jgi:hypothetical protein
MNLSRTTGGWILALGMLAGMLKLVSADLADVGQWVELKNPHIWAAFFDHVSVLIGAFIAGQIVPTVGKSAL